MSVLRSLEAKLAGLVEGTFSRAFKSEVRPVEIARKLAREMEQHKTVSVSRTYVPNEYRVWLSPSDREQFAGYEDELLAELEGYLLEHARRERVAVVSRPRIEFRTDERLRLGEFGIQARMVRPDEEHPEQAPRQAEDGHTMVYSASEVEPAAAEPPSPPRASTAILAVAGRRRVLDAEGAVIGRSRDCDVQLEDANVSRRHAEVRPQGTSWTVADLGSTNGVKVNGVRITGAQSLHDGDLIEMGTSRLTFVLE